MEGSDRDYQSFVTMGWRIARAALALLVGLLLICAGTFFVTVLRDDLLSGRGFELSRYQAFAPWIKMFIAPLGVLGLTFIYMVLECRVLGYSRSSLARLVNWEADESVQDDVFYFVLSVSSLGFMVMTVLTLGVGCVIHALVAREHGFAMAASLRPIPQFCVLLFVFTFLNYWQHRLLHYRAFWHLHKVHHAATSLNLLTPQRNHPVNAVIVNLTEALPIAMLGFSPSTYMALRIANSLYQISVHSHLDWGGDWVRRYFIVTPAMHWIHHSNKSRHWNTNFGIITLWDRLFCTLYVPTREELAAIRFGIGRDTLYNSPGRSRNMVRIYGRFLRQLGRDARGLLNALTAVGWRQNPRKRLRRSQN